MPSAQDCAERLREQAYRTLLPQVRDLEQELERVNGSLLAGFEQIERKLESLRRIELPASNLVLDEILGDLAKQTEAQADALVSFLRGLRRKETQEEILSFLLDSAHEAYPRAALFAVRQGRFIGWSSRGFAEEAARNIASCSFSCSEYPLLEEALDGEDPVAVPEFAEDSPLRFLREDASGPWHAVALRAMQKPVAVLLTGGGPAKPDTACVMAGMVAMRLENTALKILRDLGATLPSAPPAPEAQATAAAAVYAPVVESAPAAPVEGPAVFPVPPAESIPERAPEPLYEPAPVEPMPEPEAPVEAEPAVETAAAETFAEMPETAAEPQAEPPSTLPEAQAVQPQEPKPVPEEEKLHSDAKRFARLLVSEIKLYNEHHVKEGRGNRDLYIRLKKDIDRSREMYEKRISPVVAQKIDYFHDEIIRILGDNDPSTLGSDYPGPRVES